MMSPFKAQSRKAAQPGDTRSAIRGKISGPIPIANKDEDDEFPIRAPGTGIATPLGLEETDKQLRIVSPSLVIEESSSTRPHSPTSMYDIPETQSRAPLVKPVPDTSSRGPTSRQPVQSIATLGTNTPSVVDTLQSSLEKPQRRKSTFRSALSKIFGRKKKRNSAASSSQKLETSQHFSDPLPLQTKTRDAYNSSKRASLPVDEFSRALRSHTPLVDNSEEARHNSSGNMPIKTRPRGATTPGRPLAHSTNRPDWGLTPRPVSSRMRLPHSNDNLQPIGTAVTSGSHPNRRSRSLNHLRSRLDEVQDRPRRRSDEIRYWRESYDPDALSPVSSNKENEPPVFPTMSEANRIPQTRAEPETRAQPQPFNFGPLGEMAGMKITKAASFESRVSTLETRVQRVERAIGCQNPPASSVPMIDILKAKASHGNSSMARLRTEESEWSLPEMNMARKRGSGMYQQLHNLQANNSFASQQNVNVHNYDSRPSTTSTTQNSPHPTYSELSPPPSSRANGYTQPEPMSSNGHLLIQDHNHNQLYSSPQHRPLSTSTTIRGIPSSPIPQVTNPQDSNIPLTTATYGALTAHHYSALLNLIAAEREARQALETTVLQLQHQLRVLTANNETNPVRRYGRERKPMRVATPGPGKRAYDNRGLGLDGMPMGPILPAQHTPTRSQAGIDKIETLLESSSSTLSLHRQANRDDVDGEFMQVEEDDSSDEEGMFGNDVFRTPNEGRSSGDGLFEAEMAKEELTKSMNGRTLSLSQMTMGRV